VQLAAEGARRAALQEHSDPHCQEQGRYSSHEELASYAEEILWNWYQRRRPGESSWSTAVGEVGPGILPESDEHRSTAAHC